MDTEQKKINLIFWQNCISPHQYPYIKELHKVQRINKVYLVAPVLTTNDRKLMGWENFVNNEDAEEVEIIIAPTENQVHKMFNDNQLNSIHLFSGIRADKNVYDYFRKSLNYNVKRGIITEPPFDFKMPLILHKLRFLLFDYRFISEIDYVFGMGEKAVEYYKFWSKKWKVFLFGYCVTTQAEFHIQNLDKKLKLVFVGNLIKRKNVSLLLKSIHKLTHRQRISLDIIGDGPEQKKLMNYVKKHNLNNEISFLGKLSISEIPEKLQQYDVLVLPSIHDGWGAVINEGLQSGLYIISSDNCGAKTLIENSDRGLVFKNKSLKLITSALEVCIQNSEKIRQEKLNRIQWSEKINGTSIAKYMVDCLVSEEFVKPVWKD